jgi:hypothetical protein
MPENKKVSFGFEKATGENTKTKTTVLKCAAVFNI